MNLPIDVVDPNQRPPRFRWRQTVDSIVGKRTVETEGPLPPAVEDAVLALVVLARAQAAEIAALKRQVEGHADRIAAQSELLGKRAEAPVKKRG